MKNTIYIYKEGDYHCDKCGMLGDFLGGGEGKDGIERCALLGLDNNKVFCEKCLDII